MKNSIKNILKLFLDVDKKQIFNKMCGNTTTQTGQTGARTRAI